MPDLGSRTPANVPTTPLFMIALGIGWITLGQTLDGFARGLLQGAGVVTVLISVAVLSAHLRRRKNDGDDGLWLPSRDNDTKDES